MDPFAPTREEGWQLVESGVDPLRERTVEALLTVANGRIGTRGSLEEQPFPSLPATFVAALFAPTEASPGVPELVVAPSWVRFRLFVAGDEVRLDTGRAAVHRRVLDLRRGVLLREWVHLSGDGRRTAVRTLRFASLADRRALGQLVEIVPENYTADVALELLLELPDFEREQMPRLETEACRAGDAVVWCGRVTATGDRIAVAAVTRLEEPAGTAPERTPVCEGRRVGERWHWQARLGTCYRFSRIATIASSLDGTDPEAVARRDLARLAGSGVQVLLAEHEAAWARRWEAADVRIAGDPDSQRAIRFAVAQLCAAANPEDPRASIGARTLSGTAYKGHVFWDTETYILPFFIYTDPPTARSLLRYRHRTLPAAREKARALGFRGALYAWESADSGRETTPAFVCLPTGEVVPILSGLLEHHISADIPFAVWQYWEATGDDAFMREAGGEIFIETARFWESRVTLDEAGRGHILRVIGPDEYHESVDDNAYTNHMAKWTLEHAATVVERLGARDPDWLARARAALQLGDEEPARWRAVAARLVLGEDPQSGLIEQFRGFFDLEQVDLAAFEPRSAPMDVVLGRERTAASQVIKQADVVMLLALLEDRFPLAVRRANYDYYEPRTGHGSSLSPCIHAWVAFRLGDLDRARRYWREAIGIDLVDTMANTAGGVHAAALGGLWLALVFGALGFRPGPEGVTLDPCPLQEWEELGTQLLWRGSRLRVEVRGRPAAIRVDVERAPARVRVGALPFVDLAPGQGLVAERREREWTYTQAGQPTTAPPPGIR